ncbi:uroporphyrinogen-III synthase [Vibrio gallaecicus]|uniref:Uroporphyrinogen-III synthase n=1 Tax=Vibrio gallaecicus TaxID=552386 RepID=A0ABV4NCT8_9VIBR
MTVLVTRPGKQGQALCQQLADEGIQAIHHPLIRIADNQKVDNFHLQLKTSDLIIAVSQHAATSADNILSLSADIWPLHPIYLAVGQKTAQILSKLCEQPVNYPEVSDSEHLLQLKELQDIEGKRITILRGNGGRELIRDSLLSRGATVTYSETYHREYIPIADRNIFKDWIQCGISKIVITSQEQLEYLVSITPDDDFHWLQGCHLFVPSQRIANRAQQLGFSKVENTLSATNQILLAALQP